MKISFIIPCYNEEANLQKGVIDKIGNFTQNDVRYCEVIIVDDGSTDKSREIIQTYERRFPKLRLIQEEHRGKAQSVISGIKKARGDHIIFLDMDLATPIEEADKLIKEIKKGYSIVIGSRSSRRQGAPLLRKIMAHGAIFARRTLFGIKGVRDTQCGFKLFNTKTALHLIENLKLYNTHHTAKSPSVSAGFDIEMLFVASKFGYQIKEVPVTWRHVETKNVHFIKDSLDSLKDYIMIKTLDLQGKYNL